MVSLIRTGKWCSEEQRLKTMGKYLIALDKFGLFIAAIPISNKKDVVINSSSILEIYLINSQN